MFDSIIGIDLFVKITCMKHLFLPMTREKIDETGTAKANNLIGQ